MRDWLIAMTWCLACGAGAQTYPIKPIQLSVPFAPGGTTDLVARTVAEPLGKLLGQTVVVVNKPGGGGVVGATELARAAPDGYSLGLATLSSAATNPALNPRVTYKPLTDFTPIINIMATPNVLAVHPSFPAKDMSAFLKALRARPGQYDYASSGTGGIGHLQMELFKSLTHTFVVHIPYSGAGPALRDTVGGQVPIILDNLPSALPHIQDGRLVAIAVASPQRVPELPTVPTFKELGLEAVNRPALYGIWGPKGMSKPLVTQIHQAVQKVLQDPAVIKRIEATGSRVVANSPEQFAAQLKTEYELYKQVVNGQKLQLD
ncbi:MAG: tripartite tricarboxylate transporter substrate binding protein BugE [Betaproteobacteria bacterium]|nr:tripartite tricarboxylate transporter substrate binding protein BugE [Betaproteobacteria bacterium]